MSQTLTKVAQFYSERARYPLHTLRAGHIVVAGSERYLDASRPENRRCVLWMGVLSDRAILVTQPQMVDSLREKVDAAAQPSKLMEREITHALLGLCRSHALGLGELQPYFGRKFYCDADMVAPVRDPNVGKLTRQSAAKAIAALREVDIPDDADYLLAEDAAHAYFVEGEPVAFACTHPAGSFADRIGDVMVGTLRDYRRRGFGKAVISATTEAVVSQGKVAVWGMAHDNIAAIETASSIGYRQFCELFEVRSSCREQ